MSLLSDHQHLPRGPDILRQVKGGVKSGQVSSIYRRELRRRREERTSRDFIPKILIIDNDNVIDNDDDDNQ